MTPKPHQEKFAHNYRGPSLLVHETGSGKTICAALWLRDGRDSQALVICPKRVVKKWNDTLLQWGTKAKVVSKEEFKKMPPLWWSGIVVDEADEFASPLFTKGRSALSTALYELVKSYQMNILLLTATPIRSNPWNLHTLLTFTGNYIDWKDWRKNFFYLQYPDYGKFRFLRRPAYMPLPDWRQRARTILEDTADIVLLKDCVGELPPVEEVVIKVKSEDFEPSQEIEPRKRFVEEHMHEQKKKVKAILEIAKGYRKILVVAYYREQIEQLEKELSKDRQTFTVYGGVKDQESLLKEANEVDECFLIVQASLGAGFDADSFSCVVFVSMSYAVRDFVQMKGRVRRIHNLHPVVYNYLIGGRCDKAVKNNVDLGKDFVPSEYKNHEPPPTPKTE